MVFGINNNKVVFNSESRNGQVFYLLHYYSRETGGEIYSTVDPKLFSNALDYILTASPSLHHRIQAEEAGWKAAHP